MVLVDRHIHQLRLRGPSTTAVRRGARLLEDALRTASLPVLPGRVLLIRSLVLGDIDLQSNSARLALLIENRMREIARSAVHISTLQAPQANAVYYSDEPEALLLLAQRVAVGDSTDTWFWKRILPAWESDQSTTHNLPQLFAVVMQRVASASREQRIAVLHWVAALNENNLLDPVLRSLSSTDGATLLRMFQRETQTAPTAQAFTTRSLTPAYGRWQSTLREWIPIWGPTDPRAQWLAQIVVEQTMPTLPAPVMSLRAQEVIYWAQAETVQEPPTSDSTAEIFDSLTKRPERVDTESPVPAGYISDEHPSNDIQMGTTYATSLAGLFYCLKILDYLGIDDFLTQHPQFVEQQLVGHIFRAIAARLSLPLSDPALAILTGNIGALPFPLQAYTMPDRWQELIDEPMHVINNGDWSALLDSNDLPLAVWSGEAPDSIHQLKVESVVEADNLPSLPSAWAIAVERWCQRYLDQSLATLIERPAQVVATHTHLDIVFAHQQVNIRVRRTGLDFDPGWIPWLGKVVKFYYEYGP